VWISPGRHARQPDPIPDDVVDFAIAQVLRGGPAEIGRLRIKILPNRRFSVSIVAMAVRAALSETLSSFRQYPRIRRQGIPFVPRPPRNSDTSYRSCQDALQARRLVSSAKSSPDNGTAVHSRQQHDEKQNGNARASHLVLGLPRSAEIREGSLANEDNPWINSFSV
jgi:hypothetical protein